MAVVGGLYYSYHQSSSRADSYDMVYYSDVRSVQCSTTDEMILCRSCIQHIPVRNGGVAVAFSISRRTAAARRWRGGGVVYKTTHIYNRNAVVVVAIVGAATKQKLISSCANCYYYVLRTAAALYCATHYYNIARFFLQQHLFFLFLSSFLYFCICSQIAAYIKQKNDAARTTQHLCIILRCSAIFKIIMFPVFCFVLSYTSTRTTCGCVYMQQNIRDCSSLLYKFCCWSAFYFEREQLNSSLLSLLATYYNSLLHSLLSPPSLFSLSLFRFITHVRTYHCRHPFLRVAATAYKQNALTPRIKL